jgi:5-bromo-4-chloroindolyl phosphate hydrolysis protein
VTRAPRVQALSPEPRTSLAVQNWFARLSVAKALALFILPFPLLFAIAAAVMAADGSRIAWTAGALACFWTAGAATWSGLAAEARYRRGMRAALPVVPGKLLGAVLTAAGSAAAATAGGQPPIGAAILGAIGAVGHLCFYGRDLQARRFAIAAVDGVDSLAVRRQLEDAYQRLRRIEAAARTITVREFCDRLDRITAIGHGILSQIERDPRDASRARRFLNLYLDSTERITTGYALTHRQVRDASLEQNFRQLLIEMETTFGEQHRKLLEHDIVSLDVDIEVLNARLRREFGTDHQEIPR